MLFEQKIDQVKLSSTQLAVASLILERREGIEKMTVKEIAQITFTSPATVTRLAQKLGYSGFDELKEDYLNELAYLNSHFLAIDPNYPFVQNDNFQTIASKISTLAKESIDDTLKLVDYESLQKAVTYLADANQVHYFGLSGALMLGNIFKMDLTRLGKLVNVWDVSGEELMLPAVVKPDDCVIFVTYSGNTKGRLIPIRSVKRTGAKVILITSLGDNEASQYADVVLHMATREKIYSKIKSFTTQESTKLILDILYSCLFALDYDKNNMTRIKNCQSGEINRNPILDVMKEELK